MALHRVDNTYDKEKRAAHKERLAAKLVAVPDVVAPVEPATFNGVGIGGTLHHERFGAGFLQSVDKTEVVVKFNGREISFVPSAATSVLSPFAPKHPKTDAFVEDAFVGDTIVRPLSEGIVPAAEFEVKPEPVAATPGPLTYNGVPVDGVLYHPILGEGTVLSISSVITLQFSDGQKVEFPAKTSKQILTPYAPATPKEDKFGEAVFGAPIVRQADVVIPGEAERAAALKAQLAARISEPEPQPEPEVRLNGVPVGGTVFHIVFGEGALLSVEKDEVVVLFERGEVPFVPSAAKSLLSPFPYEVSKMDRFDEAYVDPIVRHDFTTMDGKEVSFADTPAPAPTPAPEKPVLFNDTPVGGTLYHPSLGAATLLSFDKTDVVLDFGFENGPVALPARQARQLLSPHAPKAVIGDDSPDEGSYFAPIARQFPNIEPAAEFETKPEPQPVVSKPTEFNNVPVGGTIYHPSLGAGTLVSFDTNEVVVDFTTEYGRQSLPARQAKQLLTDVRPASFVSTQRDTFDEPLEEDIFRPLSHNIQPATEFEPKLSPEPVVNTGPALFKGVPVGGVLYHPSLGAGDLVSFDKNNVILAVEGQELTLAARQAEKILSIHPFKPIEVEKIPEPRFPEIVRMSDDIVPEQTLAAAPITEQKPAVIAPPSVNGVEVGGTVYHEQFGLGVLKTINKTEVTVEFSGNTFSFVPSSAKMILRPEVPSEDKRDRFEDSFIDPVVRPNPVVGVAHREVSTPQIVVTKPEEKPASLAFEGRTVWHPDFGPCHVVSVSPSKNEIILRAESGNEYTLALRALESKLAILPEDTNLVSGKKLIGNVV